MRLSRIYIINPLDEGTEVTLPEQSAHYIKHVLRLKTGYSVILFNGEDQTDYTAYIQFSGKQVVASIVSSEKKYTESPIASTIIQAIGKPDHMDYFIQKATELGISSIYLFNSERTQTPLKSLRLEKKIQHWKNIAISACEQCGRNQLPTIQYKKNIQDCINNTPSENRLMLDFKGQNFKKLSGNISNQQVFSILVGAEGGLTNDEISISETEGFKAIELGPRVLRMETAGITLLSIIQHYYGDL